MSVITIEGVVEGGKVRLKADFNLPEQTKVYVIVPGIELEQVSHIISPRLAQPGQASDFSIEVIEEH